MRLSWSTLSTESGFDAIHHSSRDTRILCLQRFVRLFAYGATFIILVQFLSSLGISDAHIGLFMTLTLLGDVVISFVLTLITDQVGRRLVLLVGGGLMVISGGVFVVSESYWILVLASVIGVISPSGNEIGPFRAVEESILSQLTEKEKRSDIFAWYTMCGTAGAALGTVTSGWMIQLLHSSAGWSLTAAYRIVFVIYAILGLMKLGLTLLLSHATELEKPETQYQALDDAFELEDAHLMGEEDDSDDENKPNTNPHPSTQPTPSQPPSILNRIRALLPRISKESISILSRLLLLFGIDSFASGLASPSWLTYFFNTAHSLPPSALGTLFLTTNILATLSNLAALPLAHRLGPLKTMVFTHLPSAVFLAMVPVPSAGPVGTVLAMGALALRACTQSMDQGPRQAFLAAAVLPEERTAVLGVVNVAKTLAQAGGIGVAGLIAQKRWWVLQFGGAGTLKGGYDLLMLWMFLGLRERG